MAEIKTLRDLFKRVITYSGKNINEYEDFYEDWKKLCGLREFSLVLTAWEQIKLETTFFLSLKLWNDKLDYLEDRLQDNKPVPKQSRVEMDEDMKTWRENLRQFVSSEITRKIYLGNALKSGQMKPHEFKAEVARHEHLKLDMNKTINNTGLITPGIEPF